MSLEKLDSVKPENIREVVVPLEISQIKEFFENKELFFIVNYSKSKIKGNIFLTYISNLDLPCEISLADSTEDEKLHLLKIYMESRILCQSQALNMTAGQVLLHSRGVDIKGFVENPLLTKEECNKFISAHKELVEKWNTFVESTQLYLLTAFKDLEQEFKFSNEVETINDPHYVGSNVVQLFSLKRFTEYFFSSQQCGKMYFFKAQFEEHMFKGKNLYTYYFHPENTMVNLFEGLLSDSIKPSDLKDLQETRIN